MIRRRRNPWEWSMTLVPNRPTPEGKLLGEQLARLTDEAEKELRAKLREQDAREVMPERCRSCAYRSGTIPDGCPNTVMDALKCTMEGVPFYCHQTPPNGDGGYTGLCGGYLISRSALHGGEPLATPWPFSDECAIPAPADGE